MAFPSSSSTSSSFLDGKLTIEILEAARLPPSPYGQSDEFFLSFCLLKSLEAVKNDSHCNAKVSKIFPLNSTDLMCSDVLQFDLQPESKYIQIDLFYHISSGSNVKIQAKPILVGRCLSAVAELLSSVNGEALDVWCEFRDEHQSTIKKGYVKMRNSFSGSGNVRAKKGLNNEFLDGVLILQSDDVQRISLEPKLIHTYTDTTSSAIRNPVTTPQPVELEIPLVADVNSSSASSASSLYSATIFSAVSDPLPIFQESMLKPSRIVPIDSLEPRLLVPMARAFTPTPAPSMPSAYSQEVHLAGPYSTSVSDEFILERHSAAEEAIMSTLQAATVEGILHA